MTKQIEFENDSDDDCSFNSEPICPYCKHIMRDAWEFGLNHEDFIEVECGSCEETFQIECDIAVSYSTYKRKENDKAA